MKNKKLAITALITVAVIAVFLYFVNPLRLIRTIRAGSDYIYVSPGEVRMVERYIDKKYDTDVDVTDVTAYNHASGMNAGIHYQFIFETDEGKAGIATLDNVYLSEVSLDKMNIAFTY